MKTNQVYALAAAQHRSAFHFKLLLAALILALLASFLPAVQALAAPAARHEIPEDNNLEEEWKNKLDHLHAEGLYFSKVRFYPADFEEREDLAQVHYYLEKYGVALRQANTVVLNHAGFDIHGKIIDLKLADQSVHELAMYLHMMRGLRDKIDEVDS